MTNLIRSDFQAHLVSPSPWPFYSSISLLTLICIVILIYVILDLNIINKVLFSTNSTLYAKSDEDSGESSDYTDPDTSGTVSPTDTGNLPAQTFAGLTRQYWEQELQQSRANFVAEYPHDSVSENDNAILGTIATNFYQLARDESNQVTYAAFQLGSSILIEHGFSRDKVMDHLSSDGFNRQLDSDESENDSQGDD